ncbi:ubiquitin carboxyl-terminal hydrolase [Anaeramoeba flamelloides]|uniref:Ubiquitin carboxyl-terminal hydrolase n=1 Tax=Anaeramoeba flamelloides TaxID=1746091 RepID=A0AAV7YS06_9EUKA|nr:ubiquitin carboxyl-terminal hydrolase [Anaeramoeba flamelloides]
MTRSSKNDLQIDEDISLPFDINHLTTVCEKARMEYTNKLVAVESSESDEIMVVSSNETLSQKVSMEKKIESIFTNTDEDEDDILEEWSEDANSDRSGDTKLSKVVLEDNIIGINWRDNLCWFDSVIHSLTFVEGFVDWLKAIDTNEAKMLRAMLVSIRISTTISRRKSRELKNLLMSARDKLLKSAPQEYHNGDLNHVSSAIVILDAIFQKHPKYKGDMTSDYFRVYDKNICEGKKVVPLAPTVVYLIDKPLLNDLPVLCRDFFNATSWEINSTEYYYNFSQEVHLIIDRAPSEYLFISCSDLDFRFDSLLDWSLGGNRYWLQSLVLFQGNHYTSLVRIISTWYHFNDIGRSTYKGKKIKTPKDFNNLLAGKTVSLLIFSKSKY